MSHQRGDLDGRRSRFENWFRYGLIRMASAMFASQLFPEKRRTTFSLSYDEWNDSRVMVKVGEAGTRTRLVEAITCKWSGAMESVYERQYVSTHARAQPRPMFVTNHCNDTLDDETAHTKNN